MKKVMLILVMANVSVCGPAMAAARELIDLGGARDAKISVAAMNNSGQVVGYVHHSGSLGDIPFFYGGTPIPTGSYSYANGINDSGGVVGMHGAGQAFLFNNGQVTGIATPSSSGGAAVAINNLGDVAGHTFLGGNITHAFVSSNGTATDIGTLGAGGWSQARDINNNRQVVGESSVAVGGVYHAYLWGGDTMTDLGTLGGEGGCSSAERINDLGQVVGWSTTAGSISDAFIYSGGIMTDLGTMGGISSKAHGINNLGQIVGEYNVKTSTGTAPHAFLWSNGTAIDLDTLLAPQYSGWHLMRAIDINENGWIVGEALSPDDTAHAFILTPEPGTVALLAFGGMMMRRRRL